MAPRGRAEMPRLMALSGTKGAHSTNALSGRKLVGRGTSCASHHRYGDVWFWDKCTGNMKIAYSCGMELVCFEGVGRGVRVAFPHLTC